MECYNISIETLNSNENDIKGLEKRVCEPRQEEV